MRFIWATAARSGFHSGLVRRRVVDHDGLELDVASMGQRVDAGQVPVVVRIVVRPVQVRDMDDRHGALSRPAAADIAGNPATRTTSTPRNHLSHEHRLRIAHLRRFMNVEQRHSTVQECHTTHHNSPAARKDKGLPTDRTLCHDQGRFPLVDRIDSGYNDHRNRQSTQEDDGSCPSQRGERIQKWTRGRNNRWPSPRPHLFIRN